MDDLHAGSMAKEEQLVESLLMKHVEARRQDKAVPLAFRGGLFGPPPGTRDWSIVRVWSSSPPMGCRHVLLTDCQGAGWGLIKRGEGKRRRPSVHHHCMNTGPPATPSDTHVTSDYQTTWLNMHLREDLG